jgi:hypothetical protein
MFNFFNTATNAVTSLTLAVGNPFDVVKQIFTDYADPIKNMLYAGAICALVVCGAIAMLGGPQQKQKMKSHVGTILVCVVLAVAAGYFVQLMQQEGAKFQTIIPVLGTVKSVVSTVGFSGLLSLL